MPKRTYLGLFLISLVTLMHEILMTRIFSITMDYHFAYVGISVCLFGMTVGALIVYLCPKLFPQNCLQERLALSSLLFSGSIVLSFLTHLSIPYVTINDRSLVGLYSLCLIFVVASIPFIFSGLCICLAISRYSENVSRLYAIELAGSAIGCLAIIYTLKITDGPTTAFIISALASLSAMCFAWNTNSKKLFRWCATITCLLLLFSFAHTILVRRNTPLLRLLWVKAGRDLRPVLFEKWNSFSRITIVGNPEEESDLYLWGYSPTYQPKEKVKELIMTVDSYPVAPLLNFDGDLKRLEHLKYFVPNFVHYMRPNSNVLVLGVGMGRDILSALVFGQRSITGIEINPDILEALTHQFGDFAGHLEKNPNVRLISGEARSYLANQPERFDIIQASLLSTSSATAPALSYTETDLLYTVESWKLLLDRLTNGGILSFTKSYMRSSQAIFYRFISLAAAALRQRGIMDPQKHIILLNLDTREYQRNPFNIVTILISPEPFSDQDLNRMEELANKMGLEIIISPRYSANPDFQKLASGNQTNITLNGLHINTEPPTDDKPTFEHLYRFRDVFNFNVWKQKEIDISIKRVVILNFLAFVVLVLSLLSIVVPLRFSKSNPVITGKSLQLLIFFGLIGFGFIFVEIAQVRKFEHFLGNPTYSLSVVLFSLLLAGGCGSYLTQRTPLSSILGRLFVLLAVVLTFGFASNPVIHSFEASTLTLRILIASFMLFPLGLALGIAFPLGMKLASAQSKTLIPWLWGINGAACATASVLVVVAILSFGISASYWMGFAFYVLATLAYLMTIKLRR